jgi:hypothetical protein
VLERTRSGKVIMNVGAVEGERQEGVKRGREKGVGSEKERRVTGSQRLIGLRRLKGEGKELRRRVEEAHRTRLRDRSDSAASLG